MSRATERSSADASCCNERKRSTVAPWAGGGRSSAPSASSSDRAPQPTSSGDVQSAQVSGEPRGCSTVTTSAGDHGHRARRAARVASGTDGLPQGVVFARVQRRPPADGVVGVGPDSEVGAVDVWMLVARPVVAEPVPQRCVRPVTSKWSTSTTPASAAHPCSATCWWTASRARRHGGVGVGVSDPAMECRGSVAQAEPDSRADRSRPADGCDVALDDDTTSTQGAPGDARGRVADRSQRPPRRRASRCRRRQRTRESSSHRLRSNTLRHTPGRPRRCARVSPPSPPVDTETLIA